MKIEAQKLIDRLHETVPGRLAADIGETLYMDGGKLDAIPAQDTIPAHVKDRSVKRLLLEVRDLLEYYAQDALARGEKR